MKLETEFGDRLVTLSNGSKGLRGCLRTATTPDVDDEDVLHMRASDETLDRYDEIILAGGWELDEYRKNPVVQNAHQYGDIIFTIGTATMTEVRGNALVQTWKFASKANPMAKVTRDLYRGGFLHASSVGFIPKDWENGKEGSGFRRKFKKQELLEVSAVGIPANPNALTMAYKAGAIEKSDLRELAALLRHIDVRTVRAPKSKHLDEAREIIEDVKIVEEKVWICAHCDEEILEKHLYGWDEVAKTIRHSDCGGLLKFPMPDAATLKRFCKHEADTVPDAGAAGDGIDAAQWRQFVSEVLRKS